MRGWISGEGWGSGGGRYVCFMVKKVDKNVYFSTPSSYPEYYRHPLFYRHNIIAITIFSMVILTSYLTTYVCKNTFNMIYKTCPISF